MRIHKSLSKKFSRLEELVGIVTNSINAEHVVDPEKREVVAEAVKEGLDLSKSLINSSQNHGKYDLGAGQWLTRQRLILKEAHGDLTLPWNLPSELNPNKVHGLSAEDDGEPYNFEGGLDFVGLEAARRMEKERLSDD